MPCSYLTFALQITTLCFSCLHLLLYLCWFLMYPTSRCNILGWILHKISKNLVLDSDQDTFFCHKQGYFISVLLWSQETIVTGGVSEPVDSQTIVFHDFHTLSTSFSSIIKKKQVPKYGDRLGCVGYISASPQVIKLKTFLFFRKPTFLLTSESWPRTHVRRLWPFPSFWIILKNRLADPPPNAQPDLSRLANKSLDQIFNRRMERQSSARLRRSSANNILWFSNVSRPPKCSEWCSWSMWHQPNML